MPGSGTTDIPADRNQAAVIAGFIGEAVFTINRAQLKKVIINVTALNHSGVWSSGLSKEQ